MKKGVVLVNGKTIDMEKVLIPRKNKKVKDFIDELEPNIENILYQARKSNTQAFKDREHLKKWLIANQDDYHSFSSDVFFYFLPKCGLK
jgi:hypothetical protein